MSSVVCGLGLLTLACYSNSLTGEFVFDSIPGILENKALHALWPPHYLSGSGARSVGMFTFAVNYALGGAHPLGYHIGNMVIHWLAGVTLFFVMREVLQSETAPPSIQSLAPWLAVVTAAAWIAHPVQTTCVTYVIQRVEAIMGLFYLLTIACFLQARRSDWDQRWLALSVLCCAIGMACKEVMVTAPVMVLCFDWILQTQSFRAIVRRRWGYYLGLAATWVILIWLLVPTASGSGFKAAGVVFVDSISPWRYLLTEAGVLIHYIRIALIPTGLQLDYGWPFANSLGEAIIPGIIVLALLAGTIWGMCNRNLLGLAGAWFFIILSPTSSFVPIVDPVFDHRIYLPLAAVLALVVIGGWSVISRLTWGFRWPNAKSMQWFGWAALGYVGALAVGTVVRNLDFASELTIWEDAVSKDPLNARAQASLGVAYLNAGKIVEAGMHLQAATKIKPEHAEYLYKYAHTITRLGRFQESEEYFLRSLHINPACSQAWNHFGTLRMRQGRFHEAELCFRSALKADAMSPQACNNLGLALMEQNSNIEEAEQLFRRALQMKPGMTEASTNLQIMENSRRQRHSPPSLEE